LREAFAIECCKGTFGELDESTCKAAKSLALAAPVSRGLQWVQPQGFPAFSCLPDHMLTFLAALWGEPDIVSRFGAESLCRWPVHFVQKLAAIDPLILRSVDSAHFGVCVRESTIPGIGEGLFAVREIRKGDAIGWYNGTIVYRDLHTSDPIGSRTYGANLLSCTVDRFKRYAMQIDTAGSFILQQEAAKLLFVVPSEWCSATKINDPRALEDEPISTTRASNAKFCAAMITSEKVLISPTVVEIVATKNISPGSEIFVDYGKDFYNFY
jgi:hypothetical protein